MTGFENKAKKKEKLQVYMTDCLIDLIKSPQCTDKNCPNKILVAIYLSRALMYQNVEFRFHWGTKLRDQKQETGNDCDVTCHMHFKYREPLMSFW